jgi:membrane protease YdiL (CAAX protease family)
MNASISAKHEIHRMGLILSLLFFIIPGALNGLALYVVTPLLVASGMKSLYAQLLTDSFVFASLLVAAIIAYRLEGRTWTWLGLKDRFRLTRMNGKLWLWVLGGTVVGFIVYYLFTFLGNWLIAHGVIPFPAHIPAWLDPRVTTPMVQKINMDAGGLRGNWLLFAMAAGTFFFNIVGEEFWWRGYILPRQELSFGKWTWLIHALMWSVFFHAFKYWDLVGLLPAQLVFVYVVSRTKSTTVAMWLHIFTNLSFPLFVLMGVLGVGM